ncbi:MAG: hypothetical protein H0W30_11295 [Gemmatimonadaceae bacterium]|nr:hypothetical protein [Gemmatimonadaceae bacterium]MDQ3519827.1 hypothetical protein [Gemmatimonadota bacterium]
MKRGVTRADRFRDSAVIALLAGGVALYLYAYRGMAAISDEGKIIVRPGEQAFDQWIRYYYMSRAGMWLVAAGVLVGIWAFWRYKKNRKALQETDLQA